MWLCKSLCSDAEQELQLNASSVLSIITVTLSCKQVSNNVELVELGISGTSIKLVLAMLDVCWFDSLNRSTSDR